MKKRILSLLMVLVLCFSLVPAEALAEESESAAPAAQEEVEKDEPAPTPTPTPTPTAEPALMGESAPEVTPAPTAPVEDAEDGGEDSDDEDDTVIIMPAEDDKTDETDGIAPMTADEENGIEVQAAGEGVAKVGDTEYATLSDALNDVNEGDVITLLDDGIEEELDVGTATTIIMNGHSITGDINVYDSLTLTGGRVIGTVTTKSTFNMTAPAGAEAAIDGGLVVKSGSCSISGAQVGVKGTLSIGTGGTVVITGTTQAVSLTSDPKLALYGSTRVDGPTWTDAYIVEDGATGTFTYTIDSGAIIKRLSTQKEPYSPPVAKVNGVEYATFSEALSAANDCDTVTLLADITGNFNIQKSITLDLNGHSWNISGESYIMLYSNTTLTLTGKGTVNPVEVYGGKLDVLSDDVTVTNLNITVAPNPTMSLKHGTFGKITITANGITAYDLLADGYAFCDKFNGNVMNGKLLRPLTSVTVMRHEHHIVDGTCECGATCLHTEWKNGVCIACEKTCKHQNIDTSNYTCITCGAELAASLTAGSNTTYYVGLADALNAAGDAGKVTLLQDTGLTQINSNGEESPGDADITTSQNGFVVLDLNGHSITAENNMINAGRGGDEGHLTVTGSGTIDTEIIVNDGSLELSTFTGTISTVTIDTGSISSDEGTNWRIGTLNMDNERSKGSLRSGTIGTITANNPNITAADLLVQGYVFKTTDDSYVAQTTPADGLTNVTVTKPRVPDSAITTAPAANTLTYNGAEQALVTAGSVGAEYGTMQYSLNEKDWSSTIPTAKDAGTYTVYYKVAGGTNYKDSTVKSLPVTIEPKQLAFVGVTLAEKTYDGTTDATITEAEFGGLAEGDTLTLGMDYTATGTFDDANAGDNKTVNATVTLTRNVGNYTLASSSLMVYNCTIKKATAPAAMPGELYVYNDLAKTYEVELPALPELASPMTYGTNISYNSPSSDLSANYNNGGIIFANSKLSLPILKNQTSVEDRIGTVWMTVVTDNYENFNLEINVFAKNRIRPNVNVPQASDITYGQPLSESTLSFVLNGAYDPDTNEPIEGELRWKDGSIVPGINDDENRYQYEFIPADSYGGIYAIVTGDIYVKVNPAALTGVSVAQTGTLTYNGLAQTAAVTAAATAVKGQQVEFTYSASENGTYGTAVPAFTDAGTYTVYYKANSTGHTEATGSFTVTIAPIKIDHVMVSTDISKVYDGTATVTKTTEEWAKMLTFKTHSGPDTVTVPSSAYTISDVCFVAKNTEDEFVDSPEAGDKSIHFTITFRNNNYVLQTAYDEQPASSMTYNQSGGATFTITKADAPTNIQPGTLNVINDLEKTYEVELSTLLPKRTAPCEYGAVTYGLPEIKIETLYYKGGSAKIENGKLSLTIKNNPVNTTKNIGTITIPVTTTNYEEFDLTINVNSVNKTVPVPDGTLSASEITYGDALSASTITGTMKDPVTGAEVKGTFTWKDGAYKPIAGSNNVDWIFTPDAPEYAAATGNVKVRVNRKDITNAAVTLKNDSVVYDGTVKSPELESVVLDGVTLISGQDYDYVYSWAQGTDVGQYGLTVVGYNNYEGEVTVYMSITPRTVTAPTITVSGAPFVYTGSAITPTVTVTDDLGNTIDSKEYTVSYKDNTNAGTATITITDKDGGNYIVSGSTTFTIEKAASAIAAAPAAKTGLSYNGKEQELITAGTATGGTVKYRLGTTGEFSAAIPKAANAGEYTVYYYVEGDANHNSQKEVQSLTVSIAKAAVTVTAANKSAFVGDAAPELSKPVEGTDYTVSGLFGTDKLTGTVKLAYVDANGNAITPNMAATGETIIRASGVTAPNENYTVTFADGKLIVSLRPYYTITATAGLHGSISPVGSVSVIHGGSQSFTITPDAGYAIANVRIDGVSIGAARYYTFENVTSAHTIEAVFMRVNGNPQTGVMVDETDGSYYESAWQGE